MRWVQVAWQLHLDLRDLIEVLRGPQPITLTSIMVNAWPPQQRQDFLGWCEESGNLWVYESLLRGEDVRVTNLPTRFLPGSSGLVCGGVLPVDEDEEDSP